MAKKQKKTAKKPTTTKTRTLRSFDPVGDCYVCEKSLRMRDLDIISELTSDEGTQFINFINCSHCGGAYGTYLVIEPGGMARGEFYENDAVGIEEFKRFLNGAEVSADDVIDTYLALESGEVDSFIKAANKNKPKMKKAKYG